MRVLQLSQASPSVSYVSDLRHEKSFGGGNFQVPPFQKILFFEEGEPCIRPDLTFTCEEPVRTA